MKQKLVFSCMFWYMPYQRWRLAHNAEMIFKSADSGAHHDWVSTTSFGEMVGKIDKWQDEVFKWMDDLVSATALSACYRYSFGTREYIGCTRTLNRPSKVF
jgi:hypothetical protein